jgi:hypothetical protein
MRVLAGILAIILVSGCSSMGVKPVEIFKTEVERTPLNLEPITIEQMEQIRVIIVTSKNQKEVFANLVEEGIDPVIFGFTDLGWEQLQYNMALSNKKIEQLRFQVEEYKKYYEGTKSSSSKSDKKETQSSINSFLDRYKDKEDD